jgi:hypothetical protein
MEQTLCSFNCEAYTTLLAEHFRLLLSGVSCVRLYAAPIAYTRALHVSSRTTSFTFILRGHPLLLALGTNDVSGEQTKE